MSTMRRPQAVTVETAAWKPEGWVIPKDLVTTVKLGLCLLACALPDRHWPGFARRLAQIHLRIRPGSMLRLHGASGFDGHDALSISRGAVAADYLSNIEAIRELLPGGWRCETRLVGREVLDRALRRSRGAVVWVSPFAGSDLVTKMALASAGYSLTHLSAPSHPFSPTRFGALFLNPIRLRAVNRYVARRVIVVYGNARPALAALRQVLSDNGVVSIMATGTGARSATFPFLGGTLDLATGAPLIAYQSGAALIPAFTLPDEHGGYRVELGPDLAPPESLPLDQAVAQMASRYVELLEPIVRTHPAQWEGWFHPGTWRRSASDLPRELS
jgi:lauroyl/myristoyl acyltransferase